MAKPNKDYNGFVQIKDIKDWTKLFSSKTLSQIERLFNIHYKRSVQTPIQKDSNYHAILKAFPLIIHADTGIWDDSCGIRPKQIKSFLKKIPIKYLIYALDKAQKDFNSLNNRNEYQEYSDDHNHTFYDFNEYWKTLGFNEKMLLDYKTSEKTRMLSEAEASRKREFNHSIDSLRYGRDFYTALPIPTQDSLFEIFLTSKVISKEILFGVNKEKWSKLHDFVPQVPEMLIVDPEKWNKESFLKALFTITKTKQLSKLAPAKRTEFIDLYLTFGNDLSEIPFHLLSSLDNNFFFNSMILNKNGSNKAFLKIIKNMEKGIVPDISIVDLAVFNYVLSSNSKIHDNFLSKSRIFFKDISSIVNIGEYTDKLKESGFMELLPYLMSSSSNTLKTVFELNERDIFTLFSKTINNIQTIPTFYEKNGDYTFEVIDKKDIRGYICGYPFSCQYIGGVGSRFTKYGYENEDSSFMIVSKKGVIVAQSWIWKKDSQVTFDSLESKGGLSDKLLVEVYQNYAKELLDYYPEVKQVTIGNNYGRFKDSLSEYLKLTNTTAGNCYDSESQFLVLNR